MSVDIPDAAPGAGDPAGTLIARARAADARRVALAALDLASPAQARLDDEARSAIRAELDRLIRPIEADLRHYASRNGTRATAEPADGETLSARLIAAGMLDDPALTAELTTRAWAAIITDNLPAPGDDEDGRASLLPRLANGPDRVVASAASALLAADARRRDRAVDAGRNDVSAEIHHRLVWWVAAALSPRGADAALDTAVIDGARRALAAHDEGARLEAVAERLVLAIDPSGDELATLIEAALDDRRLALVAALIARPAGLDSTAVRALIVDPAGLRLAMVMHAIGLPRATIVRLGLALAEADRRRDLDAFIALSDTLARMPARRGIDLLAWIKLPDGYRDALARLDAAA